MYCKKCGKQIPDGSQFCQFCGEKQIDMVSNAVNEKGQTSAKSSSKRRYCRNCKKQFPGNVYTCPDCGKPTELYGFVSKVKKPIYKKWWFWAACIILVFGIIGSIGENSNEDLPTVTKPALNESPSPTPNPTAKPTPSPIAEPTPEVIYSIGDSAEFDGLEITITDIKFSQYAGNLNGLNKATDGLIYCVLYVNVKNTGNTDKRFDGGILSDNRWDKYTFKLIADEENEYLESWAAYTDFLFANNSIPAQATLKDKVINYKVPIEMQNDGSTLELELSYNSRKTGSVKWSLR